MFRPRKFHLAIRWNALNFELNKLLIHIFFFKTSSEQGRYYICVQIILQYGLKLVAGNFFTSHFRPCVEEGLDKLDKPSPQYVITAEQRANLPADPYATSK